MLLNLNNIKNVNNNKNGKRIAGQFLDTGPCSINIQYFSFLLRFTRKRSSAYSGRNTSTFRITSEDSETVHGGVSGDEGNNNTSMPESVDSGETTNISLHSVSEKVEARNRLSRISWIKRVDTFNNSVVLPSEPDVPV